MYTLIVSMVAPGYEGLNWVTNNGMQRVILSTTLIIYISLVSGIL